MKDLKYLTLTLSGFVLLMFGCKSNVDKLESKDPDVYERLEGEFKNNAAIIPGFTFDSIVHTDTLLKFYVTDSMDYYNALPLQQKASFSARSLVNEKSVLPPLITLYVFLPNRPENKNFEMTIETSEFIKSLGIFNNTCLVNAIEKLLEIQQKDTTLDYIDRLNAKFAWFIYHENVTEMAYGGVDSYAILNGYIIENKSNIKGDFHTLIDSLKSYYKINATYNEEWALHNKYIEEFILTLDNCSSY